jgi:hypothetical protein
MNMPKVSRWTLLLEGHGEFAAYDSDMRRNMSENKAYLARQIAYCYEGSDIAGADSKEYWLKKPKMVLAVVLAGLQYPLN